MKQASFFGGKPPLQQWIGYCKQPLSSTICLHIDVIHSYVNAALKSRSTFTTPQVCRIFMCVNLLILFFANSISFPFAVIVLGFGALFAVGTSYLVSCFSIPATYFTPDVYESCMDLQSCLPQSQPQSRR